MFFSQVLLLVLVAVVCQAQEVGCQNCKERVNKIKFSRLERSVVKIENEAQERGCIVTYEQALERGVVVGIRFSETWFLFNLVDCRTGETHDRD